MNVQIRVGFIPIQFELGYGWREWGEDGPWCNIETKILPRSVLVSRLEEELDSKKNQMRDILFQYSQYLDFGLTNVLDTS